MPLMECRLCGKIYTQGGRQGVCPECLKRLGDLYSLVHEYMRDHEEEKFDVSTLADDMGVSAVDIQALVDLGYIERDMQLYGTRETARKKLADAFGQELDKMEKKKLMTYGGEIYSRDPERENAMRTIRRR